MSRRLVFAANWKMHYGPVAAREFMDRFLSLTSPREGRTLWFFPPGPSLPATAERLRSRRDAHAGAQNVYWEPQGAFTGEVSVGIVREAGAAGALVGHSERRHVFGETNEDAGRKVRAVLNGALTPMLCVGELLAEREAGRTEAVCLEQLRAGLRGLSGDQVGRVLVAYEPVWAIGTGRNATAADAGHVHRILRAELVTLGAAEPVILYGGSANLGNAEALLAEPEIDGVLVGGASLDPVKWAELVAVGGAG